MNDQRFSSTPERWIEISDFPGYRVSDRGRFMNADRGNRLLTPSLNSRGIWMVGLMKNGVQQKRAVTPLVANAFVPKPSHPMFKDFDTPIHLDGDDANNHYTNLTWRPLWFARKYKQQFSDIHQTFDRPIEDVETQITYSDSWSAAVHHGLLDHDICESMRLNTYVWPTGQIFREAIGS